MSVQQPESSSDPDGETAPGDTSRKSWKQPAPDSNEPDFSRLQRARASLDSAFPER